MKDGYGCVGRSREREETLREVDETMILMALNGVIIIYNKSIELSNE
jgi:hypothetical protein